jgi:hypothetical protein
MDEAMFKRILTKTDDLENAPLEVRQLLNNKSYSKLVSKKSNQRERIN